jgi:hypothetical protein
MSRDPWHFSDLNINNQIRVSHSTSKSLIAWEGFSLFVWSEMVMESSVL